MLCRIPGAKFTIKKECSCIIIDVQCNSQMMQQSTWTLTQPMIGI